MRKYNIILLFIFIVNSIFAKVILNTSNMNPSIYDVFTLKATFLNEDRDNYEIEGLNNFIILGKSTSNNYSMINGKITSEKSDLYKLKGKKAGDFNLVLYSKDGSKDSVKINVIENREKSKEIEDKFSFNLNNLKKKYYFGEKIPYTENFITTVQINGLKTLANNEFGDFSVKDITKYSNGNYIQTPEKYKDKNAVKLSLFKGILQANSSGNKIIKSRQLEISENNGGYYNEEYILGPDITSIDILPLPENKPANFSDVIGEISSIEKWKSINGKVGEAITVDILLKGKGNLELLNELPLESNDKFNIYQTVESYKEDIVNGEYYNEKKIQIAIIPKVSGNIKVPDIKIPYFNLKTKKYDFLIIKGNKIIIDKNNIIKEENTQAQIKSPIVKNIENKKNEEISITNLKIEKVSVKNNFKLISLILAIVALIESIFIVKLLIDKYKK